MSRAAFWLSLALAAGSASAGPLDPWQVSGSNTARVEHYGTEGDPASSPYAFEDGQYYDEYGLNFFRRNSLYDSWRGQLFGVFNDSEYRAPNNGVVPERVSLVREKGDGSLPYRLEFGDAFSYYSFLSLQRSIKGVQLELQPAAVTESLRQSWVFSSGSFKPSWVDDPLGSDYTNGVSWLAEAGSAGSYSVNAVHNTRPEDTTTGALDRDQLVFSATGEKQFSLPARALTLEAELARFDGDHDGLAGAASGQDRSGNGYMVELRGEDAGRPLEYRARIESYDQDFRPRGAVITPDRRSYELHSGWRTGSGLNLRGRLQSFEDGWETANPLETRTLGVNLAGPFFREAMPGLSGSLDTFVQTRDNDTGSIEQDIVTANLNLARPLPREWSGRLGLFVQDIGDDSPGASDLTTQQLTLGAGHAFRCAEFEGYATPGLVLRLIRDSAAESDEWGPTLQLNARRNAHSVGFSYGYLAQDRAAAAAVDAITQTTALTYEYGLTQDRLGAELNLNDRANDPGRGAEAYRVSLFWTHSFDKPPRLEAQEAPAAQLARGAVPGADPLNLAPALRWAEAQSTLQSSGITGGVRQGHSQVYEQRVLKSITQRQRLALEHDENTLWSSTAIIEFSDVGNVDSVTQTFERVRRELIERYGRPSTVYEVGEFEPGFVAAVNSRKLVRVMEWTTQDGVLRFGIPRRLDGQVRMEIQHRRSFPSPQDTLWSLEEVR